MHRFEHLFYEIVPRDDIKAITNIEGSKAPPQVINATFGRDEKCRHSSILEIVAVRLRGSQTCIELYFQLRYRSFVYFESYIRNAVIDSFLWDWIDKSALTS